MRASFISTFHTREGEGEVVQQEDEVKIAMKAWKNK